MNDHIRSDLLQKTLSAAKQGFS